MTLSAECEDRRASVLLGFQGSDGLGDSRLKHGPRHDDGGDMLPIFVKPHFPCAKRRAVREIQVIQNDSYSHPFPLSAYGYGPNGTHTCDVLSSSPVGCGAQEIRCQNNRVECNAVAGAAPVRTPVRGKFAYCSALGKSKIGRTARSASPAREHSAPTHSRRIGAAISQRPISRADTAPWMNAAMSQSLEARQDPVGQCPSRRSRSDARPAKLSATHSSGGQG